LGVASMAALLKSQGHECDVLIQQAEGKNFFKALKDYQPGIIAFSCSTGRHVWANKVAGDIKASYDVLTVMGGMHPTLYPEEAIGEEHIDILCVGEGEYPLLELADALKDGKDITGIKNLVVKKDGRTFHNEIRHLNDLDMLPCPDRGLYYKYAYNREMPIKRFITGVGCPFNCSFCHNHLLLRLYKGKGAFVRRKKVARVIEEVMAIKEKYPLQAVHFSDDLFITDTQWLEQFSHHYKSVVGLPFTCNIRISYIDEKRVHLLKEAGCRAVTFGLESASEYLRNTIIAKGLSNAEIVNKVALLKKAKICVLTTNMLGLPEESLEDIYETIRMNRDMDVDYVRVFIAKPHKKTELFEYGKKNDLLEQAAYHNENYENVDNIYFKTMHPREVKNLRYLFYVLMKFPALAYLSRWFIHWPFEALYKRIFLLTSAWQERGFFRIQWLQGFCLGLKIKSGRGRHF